MRELSSLIHTNRIAALGTNLGDGTPFVSMVPFAVVRESSCLVIHVSGLAAHTRNLMARNNVSLLIMMPEILGKAVHDLPRVTLQGSAVALQRGGHQWQVSKTAYLNRFPDVERMTELGDFQFVAIEIQSARHVAGFGAARTVDSEELKHVLED